MAGNIESRLSQLRSRRKGERKSAAGLGWVKE